MTRRGKKKALFKVERKCFRVGDLTFLLTCHAINQAFDRTGCVGEDIIGIVKKAFSERSFYEPGENAKYYNEVDERWVELDGPKGCGTIVLNGYNNGYDWTVTTVRDANVFSQGERGSKSLTFSPFAQLKLK